MERALVSYDDIQPGPGPSLPQPPVAGPSIPTGPNQQNQQQGQPPRKKRRNNKQNRGNNQNNNNAHVQGSNVNVNGFNAGYAGSGWGNRQPQMHAQAHWDDPMHAGYPQAPLPQIPPHPQSFSTHSQHLPQSLPPKPQASLPAKPLPTQPRAMQVEQEYHGEEEEGYAEEEGEEGEEEGEGEMSRMLSREEIWDDSALIDAWEAATAEYEAMHGKSKDWKNEPVKKWYNVPPKPTKGKSKEEPISAPVPASAENSQPFDYNTFVPSHDPSLGAYENGYAGGEVAWAGRDEAFEQVKNAMYWAGYWTAVYHSHNRANTTAPAKTSAVEEEVEGEYVGEEGEEDDEAVIASPIDEDIIPTQR